MIFYDKDCSEIVLNIDFTNSRRFHKISVKTKNALFCCLNENYDLDMKVLFSYFKSFFNAFLITSFLILLN